MKNETAAPKEAVVNQHEDSQFPSYLKIDSPEFIHFLEQMGGGWSGPRSTL
jgi:hypothetical protein